MRNLEKHHLISYKLKLRTKKNFSTFQVVLMALNVKQKLGFLLQAIQITET